MVVESDGKRFEVFGVIEMPKEITKTKKPDKIWITKNVKDVLLPWAIEAAKVFESPTWSTSTVIEVPVNVALVCDVPTTLLSPIWSIFIVKPVPDCVI